MKLRTQILRSGFPELMVNDWPLNFCRQQIRDRVTQSDLLTTGFSKRKFWFHVLINLKITSRPTDFTLITPISNNFSSDLQSDEHQ